MNFNKGFSLIEVLLAIGILSGITLVLTQSFISTTRTSTKIEVASSIKQSGDFSVRIFEQHIKSAQRITSPNPCSGASTTSVALVNQDGGSTTFQCVYDSANGVTRVASVSGASTQYLTPASVTLGGANCGDAAMSLRFVCTSYPGQPSAVQMLFSLAQAGLPLDQFQRSRTSFQTTVNVRN